MKRSKFSLSHTKLLSCNMGELIPCGLVEVLPGDTFQQATSLLIRVAPLLAPVMHPVRVRIHHWFVPHRIIWPEFEQFITGGPDGDDATELPYFELSSVAEGSLHDYLGVPPGTYTAATQGRISALPARAYATIFNEFYRDQDLVTPLTVSKASGLDTTTSQAIQFAAWEKDYFTSARPWPQKGPGVVIPLGDTAPVVSDDTAITIQAGGSSVDRNVFGTNANTNLGYSGGVLASNQNFTFGTNTGLFADLSNAVGANVTDFREAMALQRYMENRARYGSRFTEYLAYLGVKSSDARLQRPEYLGGGIQTIQFSEVLQTGPDASDEGVASLKGHGIGAMRSNRYRKFFEEHGYVISLISVLPKTMYMQALPRTYARQIKEDFWQHELQHVGQQEVLNREIFMDAANPTGTFGYQDRYDEYRRMESSVSGEFRSTLNYWHYARDLGSAPTLNASFVTSNPTNRVYASTDSDQLYIMASHSIQARRLVAKSAKSFIF
ncbi:major capsid protein [Apis mellifera associated microvirus 46]|nr:major capsid protein [Apis mellifera associated microvirus 46]